MTIRIGILGAAKIAPPVVINTSRDNSDFEVVAVAARDPERAKAYAAENRIPQVAKDYDALVRHADVDLVYNALPPAGHAQWTIAALEAGKHVLCEKPIAMTAEEARTLIAVRERTGVLIGEAFMIRSHPQWLRTRDLIDEGRIGALRSVAAHFSYFNNDPTNIRNQPETGGGALYDIGCYCIQSARYAFGIEPTRVCGLIDRDPQLGTDRLTSAILDFPGGHAIFTSSTQLVPWQRVHFFGTKGRIEIEIPFNAPPDRPTRLFVDDGSDIHGSGMKTETFPIVDQYTLQGDAFSRAILEGTPVPVPLEEAIANMAVIDAIFLSAKSDQWQNVNR